MFLGKYRGAKTIHTLVTKMPFLLILGMLLIGLSGLVHAGIPVGDVYFYNVYEENFSVVWQVDTPSTCTVEVYMDAAGTISVSPVSGPPSVQLRLPGMLESDVSHERFYASTNG